MIICKGTGSSPKEKSSRCSRSSNPGGTPAAARGGLGGQGGLGSLSEISHNSGTAAPSSGTAAPSSPPPPSEGCSRGKGSIVIVSAPQGALLEMKTVQDLLKDCHDLAIDAPQSVNAVQSKKQNEQAARLRRTQQLRQRGPQHNRSPTSQPGLAKQEKQQEPPRRHRRPTVAKAPAGTAFVHAAAAYSPDVSTHEPF